MQQKLSYPLIEARERAVDKAIEFIQNCAYKGTAIKVELEAQLGRNGDSRSCRMCSGRGEFDCSGCDGLADECITCEGVGTEVCDGCEGAGRTSGGRSFSEAQCKEYILSKVSAEAKKALVYGRCYYDGSVDTEFTFTVKLENVRCTVEYIRAFKDLANYIGGGLGTNGAGMHIAILNSKNATYPEGNALDSRRAENFKYTMNHLMPALFFLASPDHRSRRLNYRVPGVSLENKYYAISGLSRVFEYRVFETCYERPEAILDNFCVIANTLKYYHYRKISLPFFGKIGAFGFKDLGQGVGRFFDTEVNYQALMAGVKVLKPSYKTIRELRQERNFKLTLLKIRTKEKIKDQVYKGEFVHEKEKAKKSYQENAERWAVEYERLKINPNMYGYSSAKQFLRDYPNKSSFINRNYCKPKILTMTEEQYVEDKKRGTLGQVATVINI